MIHDEHDDDDIYCWTCLIFMLMLMLDLWLQLETPGVTHFGVYHRPLDGHFLSNCSGQQCHIQEKTQNLSATVQVFLTKPTNFIIVLLIVNQLTVNGNPLRVWSTAKRTSKGSSMEPITNAMSWCPLMGLRLKKKRQFWLRCRSGWRTRRCTSILRTTRIPSLCRIDYDRLAAREVEVDPEEVEEGTEKRDRDLAGKQNVSSKLSRRTLQTSSYW